MEELWVVAFPILIVDVANPVLLAATIFCLSSEKPYATSLALIGGHTLSYLLFGLLLIFGLADIFAQLAAPLLRWIENPQPGDFIIGLLIGLTLLWIAFRWRINPPDQSQTAPKNETGGVIGYLFFGAVVNVVGAPFAVPYLAFINQLLRLDDGAIVPNLILYNLLYALPFLLVPLGFAVFGKGILPLMQKINALVDKTSAYIMPVLLGILGFALVLDAVLYFATGSGLI